MPMNDGKGEDLRCYRVCAQSFAIDGDKAIERHFMVCAKCRENLIKSKEPPNAAQVSG